MTVKRGKGKAKGHIKLKKTCETCETLIRCTSFHCSKTDERKPLCNDYLEFNWK